MIVPVAELILLIALVLGRKETPECNNGEAHRWLEMDPVVPVCNEEETCGPDGNKKNYCVNGSCVCFLANGYALNESTGRCDTQIDECECDIANCEHTCHDFDPAAENEYTTYECSCDPGYELYNISHCQDIDECAVDGYCGENATCENTEGRFECTCGEGWEVDTETGVCIDIDECADANGNCSQNCENSGGSFSCTCFEGFVPNGDGTSCDDVDECSDETAACGIQVDQCTNEHGSYSCTCKPGYAPGESGPACEGINQCDSVVCGHGGVCNNENGTFSCDCGDGFRNAADGLCEDIDECQAEEGAATVCGDPSTVDQCLNSEGSWNCTCVEGYSGGVELPCTDDDECELEPEICAFGTCEDLDGTFSCDCTEGYASSGLGTICEQVDECATGNICGENSVSCEDAAPGYQCTCVAGYSALFASACLDIDECEDENICGDAALACDNAPGNYSCHCGEGYTGGAETECSDIDECSVAGFCENDGVCSNSVGSFNCTCNYPTYTGGVGQKCDDNDECVSHPDICGAPEAHMVCVNSYGGYSCICAAGYRNDTEASACVNIDECFEISLLNNCGRSSISCSDTPGSFQCTCATGFQAISEGAACTDIDECDDFPCDDKSSCENSDGSFLCTCLDGFEKNESGSCSDIDECQQAAARCGEHLTCENSEGTYTCDCGDTGNWPGPGFQCSYDRQLLVEVEVREPWSVDLMDKNSDSYKYLEDQIPSQVKTAVSNSESLSSKLVSAEMTGLNQHNFTSYMTLDFTHVPTAMTDEEILQQIRDGYAAADPSDMAIRLDMATLAIQREPSENEGPQIELQCNGDSMEAVVDSTNIKAGARLSLMDPSCEFEMNEDGDYVISTDYTLCDTKKTSNEATINYIQYVLVNATVQYVAPANTALVSHDRILAGLNCIYLKSSLTMTSLVVDDGPIVVEEAGSFSVEMSLYIDNTFTTKHTNFPVTVKYLDDVYIGTSLSSPDSNLRLNLDSCWLTNSPNVYNPIRLYIMHNYCPTDPDFAYVTGLRSNTFVAFRYDAQIIIAEGKLNRDIYYTCQYIICDLADEEATCPDETNSCDSKKRRRKRRSADEPSVSLYLGMVTLNVKYEEEPKTTIPAQLDQKGAEEVEEEKSVVPAVAVSSVATLVLCMALFGVAFVLFRRFGKQKI